MIKPFTRALRQAMVSAIILSVMSCGGGSAPGSSATSTSGSAPVAAASNVVTVTVDGGPSGATGSVNTLFTSVTVCVPGSTTECQTIDHIQVDTGSYGLRILAPVLTLSLPVSQASAGGSLAECTLFADGYSWGPVATADVQISGESASSVPVQVIGSSSFTAVPSDCSNQGVTEEDTVKTFGANGILGIGAFAQDCGEICASQLDNKEYFSCQGNSCVDTTAALTSQVVNPVTLFATDNNGTIIVMPTVAASGAASVTGSLVFGIDTQTNNASGTQTVLALDSNGEFTTLFNTDKYTMSFIDSGSNGYFFDDTAIAACADSDFMDFYCPSSTLSLSATLQDANAAASASVAFSVGNAQTLTNDNPTFTALPELAGSFSANGSSSSASAMDTFDWGLPFFYGRRVATAIEGLTSAVGTGPYVAF